MQSGLCEMSDKGQSIDVEKPQDLLLHGDGMTECSAGDAEMDCHLEKSNVADTGESQNQDGASKEAGECQRQQGEKPSTQELAEAEEEMSQDGDNQPKQEDDAEFTEGLGNGQHCGEGERIEESEGGSDEAVQDGDKEKKAEEVEIASQETATTHTSSDSESTAQPLDFPDTLEAFGYHFTEGKLRSIEKDEPFLFEVKKGDEKFNQAHYEALGEVVTEEVYRLLETEANLKKVHIPLKAKEGEPLSFIFMSDDASTNKDKLMLLIHGSGVVRAGQWARSLIINDCIDSGTQLPYIQRAIKEGYGVIVLNTNLNRAKSDGPLIRSNASPHEHAQYVWKHFVKDAKAKEIYIVAHSFGGVVTVDLMATKFDDFKKRVKKIAFTDSVHTLHSQSVSKKARKWIIEHAVNWVTSSEPVNKPLESHFEDVSRRSAGTQRHVETSWFSFEHIFAYFSET